jgi:hypothetical protein
MFRQTLPTGLALPGAGQFPVMPSGSTAMLQGNHQLVQIIHHQTAAPQNSTFPAHTQIITTGNIFVSLVVKHLCDQDFLSFDFVICV